MNAYFTVIHYRGYLCDVTVGGSHLGYNHTLLIFKYCNVSGQLECSENTKKTFKMGKSCYAIDCTNRFNKKSAHINVRKPGHMSMPMNHWFFV